MTMSTSALRSKSSRTRQQRRDRMFTAARGRCFYCGGPVVEPATAPVRDWLFVRPDTVRMVREHVIPTVRGGPDTEDNIVCGCAGCNLQKGAFTADEFRLLIGLRRGDPDYRFAGEAVPTVKRDWLVCHSNEAFERDLLIHNQPSAAIGYQMRLARSRRKAVR